MDLIQIITLALVQGLSEFLPVSSSAHLILVPILTGWQDQGLAFDVAVHIGTLCAVLGYFRREITAMTIAWLGCFIGRGLNPDARLAWAVIFATLPVIIAGFLFKDFIEQNLRSPIVIAISTIGFGLLLAWADITSQRQRDEYSLRWLDILTIGIAQALALIPGTSRSGITITAGLALGLNRQAAARFSFLLSIPAILGSGLLLTLDLLEQPSEGAWQVLLIGASIAAVSAYLCIHFFLKLLERIGMMPFVIYRLVLGIGLLVLFL